MNINFWQSLDFIKLAQPLLAEYFGQEPPVKVAALAAELSKSAAEYAKLTTSLAQRAWLLAKLFKYLSPSLDPTSELITGQLGQLPTAKEQLANLQLAAYRAGLTLSELDTKQQLAALEQNRPRMG